MGAIGQAGRKGLTNAQKIYDEVLTARNLSTSPETVDVSLYPSDTYDYDIIFFSSIGSAVNNLVYVQPNGDAAANFRRYYMQGQSTSATALVADSSTLGFHTCQLNGANKSILSLSRITGSTGGERIHDNLKSQNWGGSIAFLKSSTYWKNTVDQITSLVFKNTSASVSADYHIIVYATPKTSAQEGWERIGSLSWSSESSEKSFTNLNGDVDGVYKLVWKADQKMGLELNQDTGNYDRQRLTNGGGTLAAASATSESDINSGGEDSTIIISAVSGVERLSVITASLAGSANQQEQRGVLWTNTADNITSLDITPSASATGTAELFRKRPFMENPETLPFELIREVDLTGDQSTGQLITGLEGDSTILYKLVVEGVGASSTNDLRMRPNDDSGSNYQEQELKGNNSSASASSTSANTFIEICENVQGSDSFKTEVYIYPLSGEERPIIVRSFSATNVVAFKAAAWQNTADELTSLRIYTNNSNALGATTAKLYRMA